MKAYPQQAFITRCPQCQTYFRLFPEQLEAADGMVRCGTCLAIFNAHETLLPVSTLQHTSITLEDIENNLKDKKDY